MEPAARGSGSDGYLSQAVAQLVAPQLDAPQVPAAQLSSDELIVPVVGSIHWLGVRPWLAGASGAPLLLNRTLSSAISLPAIVWLGSNRSRPRLTSVALIWFGVQSGC